MTASCDPGTGYPDTVLRLHGQLTVAAVPGIRLAVLKALAEHPDIVLLDVADLTAPDAVALTAFATLQRLAEDDDIALALVRPSAELHAQLVTSVVTHNVPVFASVAEALTERPTPSRMSQLIMPKPSAGEDARDLVDRACTAWQLPDLAGVAALVATELAANAVRHARTEFRLTVTLRRRYLHIAARDHDLHPPERRLPDDHGGRGLLIVEGIAAAWGFTMLTDGKVVWANLRLGAR